MFPRGINKCDFRLKVIDLQQCCLPYIVVKNVSVKNALRTFCEFGYFIVQCSSMT